MVGITAKRTAIHRTRRRLTKRISSRPAADKAGGTKRTHPVELPPRFEHEDDDEHEDELWLRLRRVVSLW
jgi:hypothetical protein